MRARHLLQYGGLILMMGCTPRACGPIFTTPIFTCTPIDLDFSCSGFSYEAGSRDPFEEDSDVFVPDDDDSADDDDDDDSAQEDPLDQGPYTAATFTMTLHVEPGAGDDDDSADGVWTSVPAWGTYSISYWTDDAASDLYCVQTMAWSGTAFPGAATPSCSTCSGYLGVDLPSVDDISAPETDPNACFIDDILDDGTLGHRLLLQDDSFTRLATVDAETALADGYEPWEGHVSWTEALSKLPAEAQFSHLGFIRGDGDGTLSGIAPYTNTIGTNGAWAPLWVIGVLPGDADPAEPGLAGDYVGVAVFGLR